MFHVYPGAPYTPEWSHQRHRKSSVSTENESHQSNPNAPQKPTHQEPPRQTSSPTSTSAHHLRTSTPTDLQQTEIFKSSTHTDKCRGAQLTGQPPVNIGGTRSPSPTKANHQRKPTPADTNIS